MRGERGGGGGGGCQVSHTFSLRIKSVFCVINLFGL